MRQHGWQLPLHPLQITAMAVYGLLVATFYTCLGPFLGNRIVENTVLTLFSFAAFSVMLLFVRCTAIDPTDKTRLKKKKGAKFGRFSKLNYRAIFGQIIVRFFRKMEKKILRSCIRRRYLDPWTTPLQIEPLLPFPLVVKDDAVAPDLMDDDITFCSFCDFEVKKHSKHCRSCNRCVDGFDHHCRWLNNCIGKKNYTTFILLMVFVLLMLIIEGGCGIAIFIRCFADKKRIEQELEQKLYMNFPTGILATISALLTVITAYSSAALGQLFFFHVVLIKKGIGTYDYILAMKEESQAMELFEDSDFSSDESIDFDSPEKPAFVSRFICRGCKTNKRRLSIRIDAESGFSTSNNKPIFHASIDPWKLIKMSKEKALMAAEKARERIRKQKPIELAIETEKQKPIELAIETGQGIKKELATDSMLLKPLPLETKRGPSMMKRERKDFTEAVSIVPKGWFPGSPAAFSSPRRRFSGSPTTFTGRSTALLLSPQKCRSNFDPKLTEVSRELETYISRQVLCSILKREGEEGSPR